MDSSPESLARYARIRATELCDYLAQRTRGVYNSVEFIDPTEPQMDQTHPNLYLHLSQPAEWDRGVLFNLFAVDEGDVSYEPRFALVEEALQSVPEVRRICRENAPNSMMKDMLSIEVFLSERRAKSRLANVDSSNTETSG